MSDNSRLHEIIEEEKARRKELRSEMSFERCVQIKEIGEFYRDRTLSDVSTEFNLTRSKARDLVVDYVKLVNHPTDQVPLESCLIGVRYYGGQYSMDEILEERDLSEEEIQTSIREFVAVTLVEQDQDIDLRSVTIPEDARYPPSLKSAVSTLRGTAFRANMQIAQSVTSVIPQVSSMIRGIRESFRPLIESLRQLASQVREAIEDGISNFESPREYNPETVKLNTLAQAAGTQFLDKVLENLEEEEDHPLDPYRDRLETGIQDFRDERFYTPIFAFISVQDGIMHWLCQEDGVSADNVNRFGDPVYDWDTKRDTLARLNQEWHGVSTGEFMSNLEAFYAHRNAVMHGDPLAYFDENIATISLLFLAMTLDTALNYGDS